MICTFFGHGTITNNIEVLLKHTIMNLIEKGVETFYVGNNGAFDCLVQNVLKQIYHHDNVTYRIILSHLGEKAISEN